MFFLYCCNWYLFPYITQHHKITEIVAFNVRAQLVSGTAVALIPFICKGRAEAVSVFKVLGKKNWTET